MSDQGFGVARQLSDQRERVATRAVPLHPMALAAEATFATAPQQQMMRVTRLAACNPSGSAGTVSLWVTEPGRAKIAQLIEYPVPAHTAVDLTALIGGLYIANSEMSAAGTSGIILAGHYEAIL